VIWTEVVESRCACCSVADYSDAVEDATCTEQESLELQANSQNKSHQAMSRVGLHLLL